MKLIITHDCAIDGKHVTKGTIIDFNENSSQDKNNAAQLMHVGRGVFDTPENRKLYPPDAETRKGGKPAELKPADKG